MPSELRNDPRVRRRLAGYYGLCESLDHELGRLMKALDELGLAENTQVVFTSDHGDMHASHGKYSKTHLEEKSLHAPLFMRLPGRIKAGQTPQTLISSVDLMPRCGRSSWRSYAGGLSGPAILSPRYRRLLQRCTVWRRSPHLVYSAAQGAVCGSNHCTDVAVPGVAVVQHTGDRVGSRCILCILLPIRLYSSFILMG